MTIRMLNYGDNDPFLWYQNAGTISSVLNIEYRRYIGRQNYIPDAGYRVIYRDMILNIGYHFRRHTG